MARVMVLMCGLVLTWFAVVEFFLTAGEHLGGGVVVAERGGPAFAPAATVWTVAAAWGTAA